MDTLLKEYRCKECEKLLCKGWLNDGESFIEIKCRSCGAVSIFQGKDQETSIDTPTVQSQKYE